MYGLASDYDGEISLELAHGHERCFLMYKERNDGGPLDGAENAKWREFTFMVKHGLLVGTSEAPRIFSWSFDNTFKRWKLNRQTQPLIMLAAPFAAMPRQHAGRGPVQAKPSQIGDRAKRPPIWRAKTAHITGPVWEVSGQNKAPRRPLRLQQQQPSGNRGDGGELVGTAGLLVRALAMESQKAAPGGLNRIGEKMCRYLRALSKGKAYDHAATEGHGRSWTNAQLFHKWKVLPARAEIAIKTVAAIWRQLPEGPQTLTPEGVLAHTANPFAVAFSKDLHLFAGLSGTEEQRHAGRAHTAHGDRSRTKTEERAERRTLKRRGTV